MYLYIQETSNVKMSHIIIGQIYESEICKFNLTNFNNFNRCN